MRTRRCPRNQERLYKSIGARLARASAVAQARRIDENARCRELVVRACEAWRVLDTDEPASGADLLEWFAEWRAEAVALLGPVVAP